MATASDIVMRALRKARVLAHGEDAEADNAAAALDDLNMMLSAWKLAAVDIDHWSIALSDEFPLDPEFEEGTVYMLASRLSPDYSLPVGFDADDFFRKIQAAYATTPAVTIPTGLTCLPSQQILGRRYS